MSARPLPHSTFERTSVAVSTGEDLTNVILVYDGKTAKHLGNFIGVYGERLYPAAFCWHTADGDCGECTTAEEAQKEIADSWYGKPDEGSFNPK